MARYTKKDADGRYYIESVNGKLESDIFGHTYGEAIDRFAKLENSEMPQKGYFNLLCGALVYTETLEEYNKFRRTIKAELASGIFEEIEELRLEFLTGKITGADLVVKLFLLKQKYTGEQT